MPDLETFGFVFSVVGVTQICLHDSNSNLYNLIIPDPEDTN